MEEVSNAHGTGSGSSTYEKPIRLNRVGTSAKRRVSLRCRLGLHDWYDWQARHISVEGRTCQRCDLRQEWEIRWRHS